MKSNLVKIPVPLVTETHTFSGHTLRISGTGKKHCSSLTIGTNAGLYIVSLDTREKYPEVTSASVVDQDGQWSGFAVFFKDHTRMEVYLKGDWDRATFENRYGPTMWFVPGMVPGGHKFLFTRRWRFKSR